MLKFLTLFLLAMCLACQSESQSPREFELLTPRGEVIETRMAVTLKEQERGLSGIQPDDFDDDEGLLFYYLQDGDRHFWMPDTYFDLDLFYLDENFKVLDVVRKLPHHKGRLNESMIPRARGVWSRHVLEMKSSSPIAAKLSVGESLKPKSPVTTEALENFARRELLP